MAKHKIVAPETRYNDHTLHMVTAIPDVWKVYAVWTNGEEAVVDFSDIIHESRKNERFRQLSDPNEFQTVRSVDWGGGIEWRCGVGIGSDQLRYMAEQQDTVIHLQQRKAS